MPKRLSRQEAIERLRGDLTQVLGPRLQSLVVYDVPGPGEDLVHALAVVDGFSADDLLRLAPAAADWARLGLDVPLVFDRAELPRSLDTFPLEFSQILAHHEVVVGEAPLAGLSVRREDLRRACEAQARSHLLHLREGYLEAGAAPSAVAELVQRSLLPLRALLTNVARLEGADARTPETLAAFVADRLGPEGDGLIPLVRRPSSTPLSPSEAEHLLPGYLDALSRLAQSLDRL